MPGTWQRQQDILDKINDDRDKDIATKAGWVGFAIGAMLTGILFVTFLIPRYVYPEYTIPEVRGGEATSSACESDGGPVQPTSSSSIH